MAASPFSTVGDLNAAYNELDVVAALRPPLKPRQWDDVFRRLVALVPVDDALPGGHEHYGRQSISDLAIQRLSRELVAERYQRRTGNPATRAAAERRLRPIVEAVQRRELTRSGAVALLMCTAANLRREGRFRALLLAWLRDMRERGVADDGALIGLIVLQSWGTDWTTASGPLIELLDHPSDEVRAYAANELGEVCVGAGRNPAPTPDTFALIQAKEIARPGIAAPFWWALSGTSPFSARVGWPSR